MQLKIFLDSDSYECLYRAIFRVKRKVELLSIVGRTAWPYKGY